MPREFVCVKSAKKENFCNCWPQAKLSAGPWSPCSVIVIVKEVNMGHSMDDRSNVFRSSIHN